MHEFDVINNADSCLIPEETTAESQLRVHTRARVHTHKLTLQCISFKGSYESIKYFMPYLQFLSVFIKSGVSTANKMAASTSSWLNLKPENSLLNALL